jgi:hypothetical protein
MVRTTFPAGTGRQDPMRVELPPGGDDARDYVHLPRRPVIEILRETALGKYRSMVIDQDEAQELLNILEHKS